MGKGALFATLEATRTELETLSEAYPDLVRMVTEGLKWIDISVPALMGDPQYALLNAKRVSEMVIDVVVSAELLMQGAVSEEKRELAAAFIHRHMMNVEMNGRRISSGDASRIKSYDKILGL
jgi:hypothetical protein